MDKIEKVVRSSITDQIFDILKDKIVSGQWKVGEKIPSEPDLASQLGVSRMSLRMAIQKLNVIGMTETRIGDGTFVCEFSLKPYFDELNRIHLLPSDEKDITDFKYALEDACISLAVKVGVTDEDISMLNAICTEMEQALESEDLDRFHEIDYRFHFSICSMTKNRMFALLYDALSDILYEEYRVRSEQLLEVPQGKETLIRHHRNIVGKLENEMKYDPRYPRYRKSLMEK